MSKRLGGIIVCKDKNIFMAFKRIPVTLDQQYDVGEKPTVILYTNNTTIHCELECIGHNNILIRYVYISNNMYV